MNRKEVFIIIICLFVGFAARFYSFDHKSLWMDEIHTYNDSRDGIADQLKFYRGNPTYLHPPIFFILTHLNYPFTHPERDLRVVPLIFGTLSILMIFFLTREFSRGIALPCTLALALMAYHISLSQDGRSYSLVMFLGMTAIYFFMKHRGAGKKRYLFLTALSFALLFHTSYSSVPFLIFSQILWFYRVEGQTRPFDLKSVGFLNGLTGLLCLPWILFIVFNFKQQLLMDPFHTESPGTFFQILYGILHDWVPHAPLMIASTVLLAAFPFFAKQRRNAIILLLVFLLPVAALYLFCELSAATHFISSRYFVNFLPLFLITLFLSLETIQNRFGNLRKYVRLNAIFLILFVVSNLAILSFYYRAEKQDLRGLVTYLKGQIQEGDKIFVETAGYIPGILHYFGAHPKGRHHTVPSQLESEKTIAVNKSFLYQGKTFTIYHSKSCCGQYVQDGSRLWIVVGKWSAPKLRKNSPGVLKGFFDGSFLNFAKFPTDASIYLFLWDPKSPDEKGIDMPTE